MFDDKVCDEFFSKIDDRSTALLCILAFRRANRYPVDPTWEQSVLKQEPTDSLAMQLQKQLKDVHEKPAIAKSYLVNGASAPTMFNEKHGLDALLTSM